MNEGWQMKSGVRKKKRFIYLLKDGARLKFIERKNNLFYLRAKVTEETIISNFTTTETTILQVNDEVSEDDEDVLPTLLPRTQQGDDSDSDSEDEEDIAIPKKQKLPNADINEAHHKWGHHGEERLKKMALVKGIELKEHATLCDACGLIKSKAKVIPKKSDPDQKAKDVGERVFVDITGPFPLTHTKWHKHTNNKLFWYGISDQYSGKMISAYKYTKNRIGDFNSRDSIILQGSEETN